MISQLQVISDGGCTGSDAYGSNNCDLDWGKSYHASVNGTLSKDIEAGATFSADLKVDSFFPLKFTRGGGGQKWSCPRGLQAETCCGEPRDAHRRTFGL